MSLVDRINYLFSSSILRLHGPNKNHDDCFHCQLIIDLKKIRQALTSKEAELQAEREKVSRYNLAVKAIHDINDVVEFQKGAVKEAEQMDRESLISHYVCAVTNWAITLYDRDKAEAELAALRADNAKLQDSLRQFLDGEREIQKENEGLRKRLAGVEEISRTNINLIEPLKEAEDKIEILDKALQSAEAEKERLAEATEILEHVRLQFPLKDYGLDVLEDVEEFLAAQDKC